MGNELFSQYSIEKTHYLTGGHLNLWKIYRGTHKTWEKKVSVFVFEKKTLDQFPKNEHESLLNILKNEAFALVKFKHPNILSIVEPLLEDKYSIGFITEEIAYSLSTWAQSKQCSSLEVKMIINELGNTISFLHTNCNIIHSNLNPDGIFFSNELQIKVSSLHFALKNGSEQDKTCSNSVKSFLNRNLSFVAPEIVFGSKGSITSDIFSLGLLLCFLIKSIKGDSGPVLLDLSNNVPEDYKRVYNSLETRLSSISYNNQVDKRLMNQMLKKEDKQRINIEDVLKHEFFIDNPFRALRFIQNITTNDHQLNIAFFKQYSIILPLFENSTITKFFLPNLLNNLKVDNLTNILLPNVFATCDYISTINFEEIVWPKLKDLFQLKIIPAASLYFLLLKMPYLGQTLSLEEFSTHCVNIICKAMDCGVVKIQTAVADALPFVAIKIESNVFKNQIYPRILQILANTTSNGLKSKLLNAIWKATSSMALDQTIVNDSLLSFLDLLCKKNTSYSLSVSVVKIYEEIEKTAWIDAIVKKIIPNLISMLSNSSLSAELFDSIMNLIQRLLLRIKQSRVKELTKEPIQKEEEIAKDKDIDKKKSEVKLNENANMNIEKRQKVLAELFKEEEQHKDKEKGGVNDNEEFDDYDKDKTKSTTVISQEDHQEKEYSKPKPLTITTSNTKPIVKEDEMKSQKKQTAIDQLGKKKQTSTGLQSTSLEQIKKDNDIFHTLLTNEEESKKPKTKANKKSNYNQWDDEEDLDNDKEVVKEKPLVLPKQNKKNKEKVKEQQLQIQNKNVFVGNNLDSLLND